MKSPSPFRAPLLAVSFLSLLLTACDQPPTRELAAAESALADARRDGADTFAAERFKEAEAALSSARQRVDQKDYRGALSAAVDAAEKARAAAAAVPSAKILLRSSAETVQAEAQAALDEAAAIREQAAQARVPESAFEALRPRAAEIEAGLAAVASHLDKGDLVAAQGASVELKARAAGFAAEHQAALDKWNAEHPRGRRPTRKR
jgi:hypothetical protein